MKHLKNNYDMNYLLYHSNPKRYEQTQNRNIRLFLRDYWDLRLYNCSNQIPNKYYNNQHDNLGLRT